MSDQNTGATAPEEEVKAPEVQEKVMSKSERKRVAAMERKQKEAQEDGSAPETPEVQPTVEQAAPRFVTLRAADKRMLELSIGELVFKGREIQVPAELEGEARRILEVGGFYLKD